MRVIVFKSVSTHNKKQTPKQVNHTNARFYCSEDSSFGYLAPAVSLSRVAAFAPLRGWYYVFVG